MKFLEQLTKKPVIFQRNIGLSIEQFDVLVEKVDPLWRAAEDARKIRDERKRKPGGGHPYKMKSTREMLFVVLFYYKAYITQELLGLMVDLHQGNVSRLLGRMLAVIEQAADPELSKFVERAKEEFLSQKDKINDWQTFLKKHPDLREITSDATEQKCHRPQGYEKQKEYYSGKKKQHSLKTQISVGLKGRILDVSKTYPGQTHDKKILDAEKTIKKFPERTAHRLDSGYQGAASENPNHCIILPFKKPRKKELPKILKNMNRMHSKRRVIVENAIARAKKFKVLGGLYRGTFEAYNQIFRGIAAILNFRLNSLQAAI